MIVGQYSAAKASRGWRSLLIAPQLAAGKLRQQPALQSVNPVQRIAAADELIVGDAE